MKIFSIHTGYLYSFIAGVFISIAINLFTNAILADKLSVSLNRLYGMSFFLLLSSVGAFGISTILERVRGIWEAAGAHFNKDIASDYITKLQKFFLLLFFLFIVFGLIFFLLISLIESFNPINLFTSDCLK